MRTITEAIRFHRACMRNYITVARQATAEARDKQLRVFLSPGSVLFQRRLYRAQDAAAYFANKARHHMQCAHDLEAFARVLKTGNTDILWSGFQ